MRKKSGEDMAVDTTKESSRIIQHLADQFARGEIPPYATVKHILLNRDALRTEHITGIFRIAHGRSRDILNQRLALIEGLEATRGMITSEVVPWDSILMNYETAIDELLNAYKAAIAICVMQQHYLEEFDNPKKSVEGNSG